LHGAGAGQETEKFVAAIEGGEAEKRLRDDIWPVAISAASAADQAFISSEMAGSLRRRVFLGFIVAAEPVA
jgi:hypothetical protein